MKALHTVVIILLSAASLFSQQSKIKYTDEYRKAYNSKTRSLTGNPGENYFQNKAFYNIRASFNPLTGELSGSEKVLYKNNSPENLSKVVFKLYQNLYKRGASKNREIDYRDYHDGVSVNITKINNQPFAGNNLKIDGTNMHITLQNPLKSKDSILIELNWKFKMPKYTKIRMGRYDTATYMVGYWYPTVAVYNDIYGWDEIQYNGLQEFNFEYADYDVQISSPKDFIIWATGVLQNPEQCLSKQMLEKYQKAWKSDEISEIVTKQDLENKTLKTVDKDSVTWYYKAQNVLDFCFATSNRYMWDASSVLLKGNKTRTYVAAAYKPTSKDFLKVTKLSKEILVSLSDSMPGITYPYPAMTVFNGADGMEYPMMVNDGTNYRFSETVFLTSHEIAHTYFPFYMGIDQVRYAWMDEGMAMFLPLDYQIETTSSASELTDMIGTYTSYASSGNDYPMMKLSYEIKGYEYYVVSYYRAGLAYYFLRDALGADMFKKCLQHYINQWNGKHPTPYDFFYTFENVSGQDLSWFFKPWFFDLGYPDLAIASVSAKDKETTFKIAKNGTIPIPISLKIEYTDGTTDKIYHSVNVWKTGNKEFIFKITTDKKIKTATLESKRIPDVKKEGNYYFNEMYEK